MESIFALKCKSFLPTRLSFIQDVTVVVIMHLQMPNFRRVHRPVHALTFLELVSFMIRLNLTLMGLPDLRSLRQYRHQ